MYLEEACMNNFCLRRVRRQKNSLKAAKKHKYSDLTMKLLKNIFVGRDVFVL